MAAYLTWHDVQNYLNTLSESELDETVYVMLEDPLRMVMRGIRDGGEYPVYSIHGGIWFDEEYWFDCQKYKED